MSHLTYEVSGIHSSQIADGTLIDHTDDRGRKIFCQRSSSTHSLSGGDVRQTVVVSRKSVVPSLSWSRFREFAAIRITEDESGTSPFPDVRWTDKQEFWDNLCKKERGMYIRQSGQKIFENHPLLQPTMRAILLDWLIEVSEVYKMHRETFYLAVDYIDRYLGKTKDIQKNILQLIGISCLFIASKIEEIYPPKLTEFAFVTDGACTEEEILSMELMILKQLDWGLAPATPNAWVKLYLHVDQASYILETMEENPPNNNDFILEQFSGNHFSKVMRLVDLCILDPGSLAFQYSVLAASAIYHILDSTAALQSSGYAFDDLKPCIDWMAPFVHALRESLVPTSPDTKSKFLSDIPCEEIFHIQTHANELRVYDRALEHQAMMLERQFSLSQSSGPDDDSDELYSSGHMDVDCQSGANETSPDGSNDSW